MLQTAAPAGRLAAVPARDAEAAPRPLPTPPSPGPAVVAAPPSADARSVVEIRGPRDLLVSSAAAVLLFVGLLSLPGDAIGRLWPGDPPTVATASVAGSFAPSSTLPIVHRLELENGMAFEMAQTPTGVQTVVVALPDSISTDLQVGDVLLVYAATGETLGTETALADILKRESANNVATYGFAVQRNGKMAVGSFQLPEAG
jgi:hypothetical protein